MQVVFRRTVAIPAAVAGVATSLLAASIFHPAPAAVSHPTAHVKIAEPINPLRRQIPLAPSTHSYTVQPGDTLTSIARSFYGNPNAWPVIYWSNHPAEIRWADILTVGVRLSIPPLPARIPAWPQLLAPATPAPATQPPPNSPSASPAPVQAVSSAGGNYWGNPGISDSAVGQLWNTEGGPSYEDATAECIAWFESGDRIVVLSPSDDEGLMQINISNAPTLAMENPYANMAEAVALWKAAGDSWSPWTTAPDCGV